MSDDIYNTLSEALKLLGPNGEHWSKGSLFKLNGSMCMLGALNTVTDHGTVTNLGVVSDHRFMNALIYLECGVAALCAHRHVSVFNDAPDTTFKDVREAFRLALERRDGARSMRERNVVNALSTPIPEVNELRVRELEPV